MHRHYGTELRSVNLSQLDLKIDEVVLKRLPFDNKLEIKKRGHCGQTVINKLPMD